MRQTTNRETKRDLTSTEVRVLTLLAEGLTNKEIAERLSVSVKTVNFHLANLYKALGASSRMQAVYRAVEQGILTTPPISPTPPGDRHETG